MVFRITFSAHSKDSGRKSYRSGQNLSDRTQHGWLDEVVDVFYSAEICKKLKPCNPELALTIFEDATNDSWTRVYEDPAIYDWMFAQVKSTNSMIK